MERRLEPIFNFQITRPVGYKFHTTLCFFPVSRSYIITSNTHRKGIQDRIVLLDMRAILFKLHFTRYIAESESLKGFRELFNVATLRRSDYSLKLNKLLITGICCLVSEKIVVQIAQ